MGFEEALQEQQSRVDALVPNGRKYLAALKLWQGACQRGDTNAMSKAASQAVELAATIAEAVREASDSWQFDTREYLASAAWRHEVMAAADAIGLRVLEENETLLSSPVVVRAQPGLGKLVVGRKATPDLRPRLVAEQLRRLREQTADAAAQQLADSLYDAAKQKGSDRISFTEAYRVFSLAPGWRRDNPRPVFAQAIYALDRSNIRTAKGEHGFVIEPLDTSRSTSTNPWDVISETGHRLRYERIRFT